MLRPRTLPCRSWLSLSCGKCFFVRRLQRVCVCSPRGAIFHWSRSGGLGAPQAPPRLSSCARALHLLQRGGRAALPALFFLPRALALRRCHRLRGRTSLKAGSRAAGAASTLTPGTSSRGATATLSAGAAVPADCRLLEGERSPCRWTRPRSLGRACPSRPCPGMRGWGWGGAAWRRSGRATPPPRPPPAPGACLAEGPGLAEGVGGSRGAGVGGRRGEAWCGGARGPPGGRAEARGARAGEVSPRSSRRRAGAAAGGRARAG